MPETGADEGKAGVPEIIPANSFDSVLDRAVRDASATPDVDIAGITKRMGGIAREEAATMDRARGSVVRDISADQDVVGQKFQNIESLSVKPWDADQQREKYTSSPLEKFGSLGSVFAIMASAFTHQPMINALNGSAAAMNAMRDREDKNYDSAYQAWKDNTQLAIQRHNIQHQEFADAITLMNTNMAAGQAKLTMLAARFGDQKTAALVEGGYIKELVELQTSRANAARGLIQMMPQLEKMDQERRILAVDTDWQSGDPKRMNMARQRVQSGQFSPEQDAYSTFVQQHPEATAEEKSKFIQELKAYGARTPEARMLQQWRQEFEQQYGHPPSADEEGAFWRSIKRYGSQLDTEDRQSLIKQVSEKYEQDIGEKPTPAEQAMIRNVYTAKGQQAVLGIAKFDAALETLREKLKDGPVSANERMRILNNAISPRDTVLSDAAADTMARQYIKGDHSVFANLGRGRQGSENVAKVRESINRIMTDEKITPEDVIRNAAEVKGLSAGEQALFRRQANIIGAAEVFQQIAPTVIQTSDKVDRTKYPNINSILLAAQRGTGGEAVVRYAAALNSLINVYSRAISGGTSAGTVSDKEHAREIMDLAWSKGQIRAAIDQLSIEINAELVAPGESKKVLGTMFSGAPPPKVPLPSSVVDEGRGGAPNVIRYDKDGNRIQ